jgi:hypothetical protein
MVGARKVFTIVGRYENALMYAMHAKGRTVAGYPTSACCQIAYLSRAPEPVIVGKNCRQWLYGGVEDLVVGGTVACFLVLTVLTGL